MRKFLLNVLFFITPLVLSAYLFDQLITSNLRKSNSHAQKEYSTWNDIMGSKIKSNIVIYGSSRAWRHISPQIMTSKLNNVSVYNLGIHGHNFWLQYLRHQLLLKYNETPKLIIHSLDIFTLQKRPDLYNSNQFLPYMLWNDDIKKATISYEGFSLADYKVPLLRYYGKYDAIKAGFEMLLFPNHNRIERVNGYQGRELLWNSDLDEAKSTMTKYKVELDTASLTLFKNYIQECKNNNIHLIFIYSPEYIEGQNFVENRNEIISLYQELATTYSIPFYDFSNDKMSFDKQYFYNALHMNKEGAEIFTNNLIDTLRKCKNLDELTHL